MGSPEEEVQKETGSFLGEFKEGFVGKFKNPFFFTFSIVWIIHNWKIVYAFFYFDKDLKLKDRIIFFDNYWHNNHFWCNLLVVAGYSVLTLILSYLIFWGSSYIIGLYKFNLLPKSIKRTRGEVVTLSEYEDVVNKRSEYYSLYRNAQKDAIEATSERNSIEKKFLDLRQENEKIKSEYQNSLSEKNILQEKVDQTEIELNKSIENESYSKEKTLSFANYSNFMKKFSVFVDDTQSVTERFSSVGLNEREMNEFVINNKEILTEDNVDKRISFLSPLEKFFLLFHLSKSDMGQHPFSININNLELAEKLEKENIVIRIWLKDNKSDIITFQYTDWGTVVTTRLLYSFRERM